jgi:hypothetical protein
MWEGSRKSAVTEPLVIQLVIGLHNSFTTGINFKNQLSVINMRLGILEFIRKL